jgi:UDPglucose 6-dehydrogenase
MNVTVIGTGYVGLIAACCLANSGHQITGVEKNLTKLTMLQQRQSPIYEEGLVEILTKVIDNGSIKFTDDLALAISTTDLVIIAVGTPSLSDDRVDLSQIFAVAETITALATRPLTVVMKSTVPPGTGKMLIDRYFSQCSQEISYVSNPEFLREGRAVWDWYNTDRIIIGTHNQKAANQLNELYADLAAPKVHMDVTSAEMVKYASNAFLATKISFINEIANLCEYVGADIDAVAPAVGMDNRIGKQFLNAGLGYGGSCFPKDTKGLRFIASYYGYPFSVLKAVMEVNSAQKIRGMRKLLTALDNNLYNKRIALLGLSFKPGTDDTRESPGLDIAEMLISEGALVQACDPLALASAKTLLHSEQITFHEAPYQAVAGCQAIILATEWPEFTHLDWQKIKNSMQAPYVLLDGRNAIPKESIKNLGFHYLSFGRQTD